jgi:hypothetical protein
MRMVHFPLATIQSPFPIQTLATSIDCNVLERLLLKIMWFVQSLSMSQLYKEF